MNERVVHASVLLSGVEDEERRGRRGLSLFIVLALLAVVVLFVARAEPALAVTSGTVSGTSVDDDDDDDDGSGDGSGSGSGDDSGADVQAAQQNTDDTGDTGDTQDGGASVNVDTDSGNTVGGDTASKSGGTSVGGDTVGTGPSAPTSGTDTDAGADTADGDTDDTRDDNVGGEVTVKPVDRVEGKIIRNAQPEVVTAPGLLGERVQADDGGGVLPFTGASIVAFLGSAAALVGSGTILARRRRR